MGVQIIEDSRQQNGKHAHIEAWMRAHGVEFVPRARALAFGDYVAVGEDGQPVSNVSVDTKKDVQELCMDLTSDHARFRRECLRAREAGWRLVILTEQHPEYNERQFKMDEWVSGVCRRCERMRHGRCDPLDRWCRCDQKRRKPVQGAQLRLAMIQMTARYGVQFRFCNRMHTARAICDLLGVSYGQG